MPIRQYFILYNMCCLEPGPHKHQHSSWLCWRSLKRLQCAHNVISILWFGRELKSTLSTGDDVGVPTTTTFGLVTERTGTKWWGVQCSSDKSHLREDQKIDISARPLRMLGGVMMSLLQNCWYSVQPLFGGLNDKWCCKELPQTHESTSPNSVHCFLS
jgi:hypothetical protein